MPSPEARTQERSLSAEQRQTWYSLVEKMVLQPLEDMEALYLSEAEQELRKNQPLTNARYKEWLAWMEEIDADPAIPFKRHYFVDEGVLAENVRAFMRGMEAFEELRANGRISPATQERLGLPKLFQRVSPEKLGLYSVRIGGKASERLETELEAQGFKITDTARSMMKSRAFTTEKRQEELQLVRLTAEDLFHDRTSHTMDEAYNKAKELGLELCPAEVGPHLRLTYKDQPFLERIYIAMKQIADHDGHFHVFSVERDDVGLWLDGHWLESCDACLERRFVFRVPRLGGKAYRE